MITFSHLIASAHRELPVKGSSQDVAQVEGKSLLYIYIVSPLKTHSCIIFITKEGHIEHREPCSTTKHQFQKNLPQNAENNDKNNLQAQLIPGFAGK